jgi:hypothetical protein
VAGSGGAQEAARPPHGSGQQPARGQAPTGPGRYRRQLIRHTSSRNSAALSKRNLIAGSLISASPIIDAQAAVSLSDSPPGPRASASRSRLVPAAILRGRSIALVRSASASRSRSAGRRHNISSNWSAGRDAVWRICPMNRTDSRRTKDYFNAYGAKPPGGFESLPPGLTRLWGQL